jgi:ectoine hydroxylase-related dioxygenase (phytanoyl-CoA dioxygenase family)
MNTTTAPLAEAYARDGFVFPYDVIGKDEANKIRADLECAEAALCDRPDELAMLRSYPDRLLPSFDKLIRNPRLIDAASQILGPDLIVWSAGLFIKEANTPSYVTWHQDLTYWGLDDTAEVTAWVALSPASVDSGCMRFMPGSQHQSLVPHSDTFADDNLLSRGQEVSVTVNEDDAVDAVLETGQASLHHGHLIHASRPNRTDDRRIGVAIRYMAPSMKQTSGDRLLAALVSGTDQHENFIIAPPPKGRLLDADFAQCRRDVALKGKILYEGAPSERGQRYR